MGSTEHNRETVAEGAATKAMRQSKATKGIRRVGIRLRGVLSRGRGKTMTIEERTFRVEKVAALT